MLRRYPIHQNWQETTPLQDLALQIFVASEKDRPKYMAAFAAICHKENPQISVEQIARKQELAVSKVMLSLIYSAQNIVPKASFSMAMALLKMAPQLDLSAQSKDMFVDILQKINASGFEKKSVAGVERFKILHLPIGAHSAYIMARSGVVGNANMPPYFYYIDEQYLPKEGDQRFGAVAFEAKSSALPDNLSQHFQGVASYQILQNCIARIAKNPAQVSQKLIPTAAQKGYNCVWKSFSLLMRLVTKECHGREFAIDDEAAAGKVSDDVYKEFKQALILYNMGVVKKIYDIDKSDEAREVLLQAAQHAQRKIDKNGGQENNSTKFAKKVLQQTSGLQLDVASGEYVKPQAAEAVVGDLQKPRSKL